MANTNGQQIVVMDKAGNVIAQIDPSQCSNIPGLKAASLAKPKNANFPGLQCNWNNGAGAPDWSGPCGVYRGPILTAPIGKPGREQGSNCTDSKSLTWCGLSDVPYQWVPIRQSIAPGSTGLVDSVVRVGPDSNGLRLRTGSTQFGFARAWVFEDSDPEIAIGKFRAPDVPQSYNAWDALAIVDSPENILRPAAEWTWDRMWKGQNFAPSWVASYSFGTLTSNRYVDVATANTDIVLARLLRGHVLVDYRPPQMWDPLTPENYPMTPPQNGNGNGGYSVVQLAV